MSKENHMEETYLTPKEAAYMMGVHKETVLRWIRAGLLKAQRKGTRLLFVPQSEVLRVRRDSR
jgi:excisionase family DNA binding protein